VSAKAKKKPTTLLALAPVVIAVPIPVASGPPPAFMPVEIAAPVPAASGPATVTLAYARGLVTTIAMGPLAREVTVLPLSRLVPLKDAAKLASDRLGSYELAAHDLAQRARTRQLLVMAQVVDRDGSKRVFVLRPRFWCWYRVVWFPPRPEDGRPDVAVGVDRVRDNCVPVRGRWHFFVERRRLEQLYSMASPNKFITKSDEVERYGMPPPGRSLERKAIQDFTLRKYGRRWTSVSTAVIRKAASLDEDFLEQVGSLSDPSTFARALGRKKD
jgi:hypothetical protein